MFVRQNKIKTSILFIEHWCVNLQSIMVILNKRKSKDSEMLRKNHDRDTHVSRSLTFVLCQTFVILVDIFAAEFFASVAPHARQIALVVLTVTIFHNVGKNISAEQRHCYAKFKGIKHESRMSFAARVERENERIIVTRIAVVHERKGKNDRKRKANYSRTGVISIRFSFESE